MENIFLHALGVFVQLLGALITASPRLSGQSPTENPTSSETFVTQEKKFRWLQYLKLFWGDLCCFYLVLRWGFFFFKAELIGSFAKLWASAPYKCKNYICKQMWGFFAEMSWASCRAKMQVADELYKMWKLILNILHSKKHQPWMCCQLLAAYSTSHRARKQKPPRLRFPDRLSTCTTWGEPSSPISLNGS